MTRQVVLALGAAALLVGAVIAWSTVRQEREFRRLIREGDAALQQGDTFLAIEAFSGALALNGDSMVAHLKRGDSYRQRGEMAAALRDLREAARLDPGAPLPAELLGDANLRMERYERAVEQYLRFVALDDRDPRVLYKLAVAYHQIGQTEEALDPVRRAIELDATMPEAHYLLGVCLRALGQMRDAEQSLKRAVALDDTLIPAHEELAELYRAIGRDRDRIMQLEALAALDPDRPERAISLGLAHADGGSTDAAVAVLERATEQYPGTPSISVALGKVWLRIAETGDGASMKRAQEALRPVAARASASSEALTLYAKSLLLSGDADAAELVLQRAVARLPVDPGAFLLLARSATQLGHTDLAQDAKRRYAALTADAP
jgi:tetratricopeptide (TPR) repeat protein